MSNMRISPAPHIQGKQNTRSLMRDVIIALMPALAVSIYFFGWGTIIVTLTAILSCVLCEWLIQKYLLKEEPSIKDLSAIVTGLILAFNLPSNLSPLLVVLGSVVAIGVGKMTFGGLGNNPFNPALVGRVFMLISFPVQMTTWPKPTGFFTSIDAATGATPLAIMKEGLANGMTVPEITAANPGSFSYLDMLFGQIGGSLGEVSTLALLIGFGYLLFRKVITWHIPITIFATIFVFAGILHLADPAHYVDPLFHLLTGGIMLGAIFMATDYVTSPMTKKGMVVFAIGIGIVTIVIRVFGGYPEGISFAILFMNAFVPLINRYMKPKRFGEVKKNG